jgi:hypothetical protein
MSGWPTTANLGRFLEMESFVGPVQPNIQWFAAHRLMFAPSRYLLAGYIDSGWR